MLPQQTMFDYAALDNETRIVVQQRTTEIKSLMRRAAQDIIDIGQRLIEVKERLGYGHFDGWIKAEFDWSRQTAYRFIYVAECFGTCNNLLQVAPSALYLLSAPSTPDSARDEAIARAEAGEPITYSTARDLVQLHKENGEEPITAPSRADLDQDWAEWEAQEDVDSSMNGSPSTLESHQLLNQSISNEWYTPAEYIEAARTVMGGIDLDPASNQLAQETIQANTWYGLDHDDPACRDGLAAPWAGRVWLNPPYGIRDGESNQSAWSRRLINTYTQGAVSQAVILVNAVPGNNWFAPLWDYPICFVSRRIRFYAPDGKAPAPTHSNVLVYLGSNQAAFVRIFSTFGPVVARLRATDTTLEVDL